MANSLPDNLKHDLSYRQARVVNRDLEKVHRIRNRPERRGSFGVPCSRGSGRKGMTMPYDLFISYSCKDKVNNRVTELKNQIETDYLELTKEPLTNLVINHKNL